ncbi:hypothetical protein DH2020_044247 [Rehmannia glutinosa]|uniref:At2g35280-like TPR domain-containing protein n=1 Tax=Rehmannia glutinosa TaxID=99300 RepID=A0ABR0UI95_REHGL
MENHIQRVPKELLTNIVVRVAASSLTDYVNVKLSCKMLKEVGEHSLVYNHVSLDEFPVVAWHDPNETTNNFINRCVESGNLDALYKKGMAEYFGWDKLVIALEYLKTAVNSGHDGACYIISIILLSNGDEFKHKGVSTLSRMMKSGEFREKIIIYRQDLIQLLTSIWTKNPLLLNRPPNCCTENHDEEDYMPASEVAADYLFALVGHSLGDKDHIETIFDGLPSEYDSFIISIITRLDPYTIDDVEAFL